MDYSYPKDRDPRAPYDSSPCCLPVTRTQNSFDLNAVSSRFFVPDQSIQCYLDSVTVSVHRVKQSQQQGRGQSRVLQLMSWVPSRTVLCGQCWVTTLLFEALKNPLHSSLPSVKFRDHTCNFELVVVEVSHPKHQWPSQTSNIFLNIYQSLTALARSFPSGKGYE